MFGSGYNPYVAMTQAEIRERAAAEPWGERIYIFPKGFDVKGYMEFLNDPYDHDERLRGEVYKNLLEKSGFDKVILNLRKEAAKSLADLEWVEMDKKVVKDRFGGPTIERNEPVLALSDEVFEEHKKEAELVMMRRAQHPELATFWEELRGMIKELQK